MRIKCWVIRDFIFGLFLVPTPYSFGAPKAIAYPITMWLYVCVAWTRVIFSTIIANGEFLFFSGFLSFSAECSNILVFFRLLICHLRNIESRAHPFSRKSETEIATIISKVRERKKKSKLKAIHKLEKIFRRFSEVASIFSPTEMLICLEAIRWYLVCYHYSS